jgi:hypothetical protein
MGGGRVTGEREASYGEDAMAYEYDEALADRLTDAILKAVKEAHEGEVNFAPEETLDALTAVIAQTLALYPPTDLNATVDDVAAKLKARVPLGAKELEELKRLQLM